MILLITFFGNHRFLIPANMVLIGYFALIALRNWFFIRILTIGLSSLVLMLLLKQLSHRKRPLPPLLQAAKGLSFPSDHAMMSVACYGKIIIYGMEQYIADRGKMGDNNSSCDDDPPDRFQQHLSFSRIYLRVHYASDVLAGFIIGLLWL